MGMFDPAGFRSEAMASFFGSSESRPESISWQHRKPAKITKIILRYNIEYKQGTLRQEMAPGLPLETVSLLQQQQQPEISISHKQKSLLKTALGSTCHIIINIILHSYRGIIINKKDWPLLRVAPCLAGDLGVGAPAHGVDGSCQWYRDRKPWNCHSIHPFHSFSMCFTCTGVHHWKQILSTHVANWSSNATEILLVSWTRPWDQREWCLETALHGQIWQCPATPAQPKILCWKWRLKVLNSTLQVFGRTGTVQILNVKKKNVKHKHDALALHLPDTARYCQILHQLLCEVLFIDLLPEVAPVKWDEMRFVHQVAGSCTKLGIFKYYYYFENIYIIHIIYIYILSMYVYIYNDNSCYVYRHRLLFHLHSFTPSQLHSFLTQTGAGCWTVRNDSAAATHRLGFAMPWRFRDDSRDVPNCPCFLLSFDLLRKQKRLTHRVGNSTGLLGPGSWWVVMGCDGSCMCSIQRSLHQQRMQGPWRGPWCLCGVSAFPVAVSSTQSPGHQISFLCLHKSSGDACHALQQRMLLTAKDDHVPQAQKTETSDRQ